jgi:WD40 repeat protein
MSLSLPRPTTGSLPARLAAVSTMLLLAAASFGQSIPAPKVRTDVDGVSLPEGAIARLGSARFRFDGHPACPVAFSGDGKLVAVAAHRSVSVFETDTGRQRHRFPMLDEHYPQVVRFLDDGKRIAVGSAGGKTGELTIYDLADGKQVVTSKLPGNNQIHIGDITPDGFRVLAVDWFAKVYLWDVKAERELWTFNHAEAKVPQPLTADGKYFVMAGREKAELRDAQTGKLVGTFPDPGPRFQNRYYPGMSPEGRIALGAEKGDAVVVLSAQGSERVRTLPTDLRPEQFFFSPDSRYLVAPSVAGTQVWDLSAPDDKGPVVRLVGAIRGGFTPDGKTHALADVGSITLFSVGDWKRLPQSADLASPVSRVRFLPDGKRVIGYTRKGWVAWPAAGGPATRLSDDSTVHPQVYAAVSADGRTACDVVHEPAKDQSSYVFAGKNTLRVTDLATGKDRRIPDSQMVNSIQLSPDGRHISTLTRADGFVVWDARTGDLCYRHKRTTDGSVLGAAPAPDGKGLARSVFGAYRPNPQADLLAPVYSDVTVTDHITGREWKMDPIPWSVYVGGAWFSSDGSKVVLQGRFSSDWKKDSVSVWDMRTGRRLVNWERQSGRLDSDSLSRDSRSLLTGTMKGQLALIEVATGGPRASFQHFGEVLSSAFHHDGTKAVSSSPDGPIYIWDLIGDPGRWDASKADAVWADLASPDAKIAFAAIRKLRANPTDAIAFLTDRVKLPAPPTEDQIAGLLKRLDGAAFAERERAQKELTKVAELIRPRLEKARKSASEESGRRLDQVLKATEELTSERLRHVRACEVIEGIGSPEAVKVLRDWATGQEGARLTIEAKESLARR